MTEATERQQRALEYLETTTALIKAAIMGEPFDGRALEIGILGLKLAADLSRDGYDLVEPLWRTDDPNKITVAELQAVCRAIEEWGRQQHNAQIRWDATGNTRIDNAGRLENFEVELPAAFRSPWVAEVLRSWLARIYPSGVYSPTSVAAGVLAKLGG